MFNRKKQPAIRSLIAAGTQIDGHLAFSDGLRVDGVIHGDLRSHPDHPSLLVISETAQIIGEIHADHVIVNGEVQGPVHAAVMLELQPKARIEGDIHYAALEMHQGALVAGQLCPLGMEDRPALKLAASNG